MNTLKTTLLLTGLTLLLVAMGGALGGRGGMLTALVFAAAMNFGTYWFSDKIVLRMYGAREVTEAQNPASTASCAGSRARRGSRCRAST